jgi:hypothetical protein
MQSPPRQLQEIEWSPNSLVVQPDVRHPEPLHEVTARLPSGSRVIQPDVAHPEPRQLVMASSPWGSRVIQPAEKHPMSRHVPAPNVAATTYARNASRRAR